MREQHKRYQGGFMKLTSLIMASLMMTSISVIAGTNYRDDLDKNTTPSTLEQREEEVINRSDATDKNATPAQLEEREKEEQVESDLIQTDDPEKSYDPLDQEFDEQ
jgi:hypothetical protein